jgi:4-hydroxy-3-methylbut-2-en-1-yl diphosphate reductase
MRLLLVNPRGFCAGVRMAIDVVDQILDICPDQTVYVYHEIVHNKHVVQRFIDRGVVFVESIDEVPQGSMVIFSAHGISPAIRQQAAQRNLTAIDATCPLVTKVHMEAIRYASKGFQILLIGHANHQEVVGTRGEVPDAVQVVESPDDIPKLHIVDPEKLVYLTQTTLSTDDASIIIDALKRAFPKIQSPPQDDICYATTNRQQAVRALAPQCDMVLVVGSRNSSNSVRLTEIARHANTEARLIDDASSIDNSWFNADESVLVTAGASAPEDLVAQVCKRLLETFGGTIELCTIAEENVEFNIPITLKTIMRDKGINPDHRRIRVQAPTITAEHYGTVPITVGESG